jgi:hypothetical protein
MVQMPMNEIIKQSSVTGCYNVCNSQSILIFSFFSHLRNFIYFFPIFITIYLLYRGDSL